MIRKKFIAPRVNVGETKTFNVYGKSFFNLTGLYLSGDVFEEDLTFFNPFSSSSLSAQYPGFYSKEVKEFSYNRNNTLTFSMPSAAYAGYVDIIMSNEAGWGALTQYVVTPVSGFNPFLSGSALYDSYTPYQRPWKDGIIVNDVTLSATFTPELSVAFVLSLTADSDGDNYTDLVELSAGTDLNNPNEFPISLFNVFNNI
jgi:hypothetical protein